MQFVKWFVARNGNGGGEANGKPLFNPSPYLAARQRWNSQIDRAFSSLHIWQLIGVASLLIALASVAGIVYIGTQAKFVPYIIEVDKLGEAVAVGPAQIAAPADQRVVRASLAAFISSARLVTPDAELQRRAIFSAYALMKTKDPSTVKMNEYLNGSPDTTPFARAARMTVNVDVSTVLPISSNAWQVDWTEILRDRDGAPIGKPIPMRATLEVYIDPPGAEAKQADIARNPLGIYIRDYNWSQK